jgi:hypothetical protein
MAEPKCCLKCKRPETETTLYTMECGAFCENEFLVCRDCGYLIQQGRYTRLCYKHGGGPKGMKRGTSRRAGRSAREDDGGPWGENANRAREGD